MVSIEDVKKLRNETGLSVSKCKDALEECSGDFDKARESLRKKGSIAAEKKADRDLNSGVIQSYIHNTNEMGSMVELLCETDFVSKNEDFIALARDISLHIAATNPQFLSRESIPKDVFEKMEKELIEEIDKSKAKNVQEKILQGKVDSKLSELILLEQKFVKDEERTIKDLIDAAVQKFGERVEIGKFIVFKIK